MKLSSHHAFVHQYLVGLLVMIGLGGSAGLGTVWLRHQNSVIADTNRDLEQQYHEIERRADDIGAQVESQLSPDILRRENETMHLGLVEMTQAQITSVTNDPIQQLVARANRRGFDREAAVTGIGKFTLPTLAPSPAVTPDANRATPPASHPLGAALRQAGKIQFATNP